MQKEEAITLCKKHIHRYVMIKTTDGSTYDGIVESVDEENVYLAVPGEIGMMGPAYPMPMYAGMGHYGSHPYPYCGGSEYRQFGPGFGYGFYGFPGYGRRRRFQRFVLPLALLTAISLLPYY